MTETRKLIDLRSVGKATLRDFALLGISSVEQLAAAEPEVLYDKLCKKIGTRQDPCVLDVFSAAVAQARNPKLAREQKNWWYWSRKRKSKQAL